MYSGHCRVGALSPDDLGFFRSLDNLHISGHLERVALKGWVLARLVSSFTDFTPKYALAHSGNTSLRRLIAVLESPLASVSITKLHKCRKVPRKGPVWRLPEVGEVCVELSQRGKFLVAAADIVVAQRLEAVEAEVLNIKRGHH